jgi:hypothetical protein
MSSGRSNKLTAQIGEYLVCAELGKRTLIATPFAGNVPTFDVLATDEFCRTVPIQVKTTRGDKWPTDARHWLNIQYDESTKTQKNLGRKEIKNPNLIYVFVAIAPDDKSRDRFFILTKSQLQDVVVKHHCDWMDKHEWKRPRAPESYDCRFSIPEVQDYENNWKLISDGLTPSSPDQSLESTDE